MKLSTGLVLLCLAVLIGCAPAKLPSLSEKAIPFPTALVMTPIPLAPEPNWLVVVYPAPGHIISWAEYQSDDRPLHGGDLFGPNIANAICLEIYALDLLAPGDFWKAHDIFSRMTVVVDGSERARVGVTQDGITLAYILDETGEKKVASVGGPYAFCVEAVLSPGLHVAEVRFNKSSGEVEEYAWNFEIVDGPVAVPTVTP